MTDPDPLPAHEREVRAYAAESGDPILRRHLTAVLAEYGRLRAVEKAAAALSEFWRVSPTVQDMSLGEMRELDQLLNDLWREMGSKP